MSCKTKKNGVLMVAAVIFVLLNSAVMADWSSSSAFDFDGDGVIGLGDFAIFASHWGQMDPALPDITWVSIMETGFKGQMSAYETTNAQFVKYLNDALGTGNIIVEGNFVKGVSGLYSGEYYYRFDGVGTTAHGATDGGKSRIDYSDGGFSVDSGFENHPVTYVSWYGAFAFAEYYGWRLPTENEWQAVANYDGSYAYATGSSLYDSDKFLANYRANGSDFFEPSNLSYHPWVEYGTSEVGYFGTFGYGLADMAGNVREWTFTQRASSRVDRGGSWSSFDFNCSVSYQESTLPDIMGSSLGFRVCR